jgi:hypothetical protein
MAVSHLVSPLSWVPGGYVAAAESPAVAWWRLRRADQRRAKASRAWLISLAVTCAARRVSRAVSARGEVREVVISYTISLDVAALPPEDGGKT